MSADKWLVAASNVVAALFGVFVGLALVDFPGVETWLEHWQTLIAGILAVVAAAVTIRQMQVSDAGQQRRHEHLIRMSMRTETLVVLRAHTILTPTFLRVSEGLLTALRNYEKRQMPAGAVTPFETQIDAIEHAFAAEEMRALRPLLGPPAAALLLRIAERNAAFRTSRGVFSTALVKQNNADSANQIASLLRQEIELGTLVAEDCRLFAQELEALAISYGDAEATK
ncbi:hypothetical protein [Mesorhizobium sp. M0847]|uniref:hypothetical protein n=1 Tax=unclassified Mesorhizobium TaxID=325217 RepID=UPI0033350D25